jgi:DNA replication licensing factor MCM6
MDFDALSSPPGPSPSLPPSSAPGPSQTPNARSTPTRRTADALAFADDEDEEEGTHEGGRRARKPRGQFEGDVPLVKDAVGESVAESFETFLKTSVLHPIL